MTMMTVMRRKLKICLNIKRGYYSAEAQFSSSNKICLNEEEEGIKET